MVATVGIVIPCYNQGEFLADSVGSVRDQTWPNWRAVVINDASTNPVTRAQCDAIGGRGVRVVHLERNMGRALVRNVGVKELGAVDYVLNLDADDILTPDYVRMLVEELERDARLGLAYGVLEFFGMGSEGKVWPNSALVKGRRYLENVIPGPGTMIRVAALNETCGWRREFTKCSGEDYDIWLQVVNRGWNVSWVEAARYRYRQHENSFLATRPEAVLAAHDLAIFELHYAEIRRSCGISAYLDKGLGPYFFRSVRQFDMSNVMGVISVLFKRAPLAVTHYIIQYYARRLLRWPSQ